MAPTHCETWVSIIWESSPKRTLWRSQAPWIPLISRLLPRTSKPKMLDENDPSMEVYPLVGWLSPTTGLPIPDIFQHRGTGPAAPFRPQSRPARFRRSVPWQLLFGVTQLDPGNICLAKTKRSRAVKTVAPWSTIMTPLDSWRQLRLFSSPPSIEAPLRQPSPCP